jgi:NADPH-dependent glutamate synthase beta subunit-like oxidoreductase
VTADKASAEGNASGSIEPRQEQIFARDMPSPVLHRRKVAVIGSGMAGLVTAYLLKNDTSGRFDVEIFETVGGASSPILNSF